MCVFEWLTGLVGARRACTHGVWRLLWLADREARGAGTTTARLLRSQVWCGAGMTRVALPVAVVGQSAEQVCREAEAADTASVARLVRGVCCCQTRTVFMLRFVLTMCNGVVVMAWSGGCGSWRAASSRGARHNCCWCQLCVTVPGSLCWCMLWIVLHVSKPASC